MTLASIGLDDGWSLLLRLVTPGFQPGRATSCQTVMLGSRATGGGQALAHI